MDEKSAKEAQMVYKTLCEALDERDVTYEKKEDELNIDFKINTSDLNVQILGTVIPNMRLIHFLSFLPFNIPEENLGKMAVAVNSVNMIVPYGFFLLNTRNGGIAFSVSQSYTGSLISKETVNDTIAAIYAFVDKYNERLFFYDKDKISLEELTAFNSEERK